MIAYACGGVVGRGKGTLPYPPICAGQSVKDRLSISAGQGVFTTVDLWGSPLVSSGVWRVLVLFFGLLRCCGICTPVGGWLVSRRGLLTMGLCGLP